MHGILLRGETENLTQIESEQIWFHSSSRDGAVGCFCVYVDDLCTLHFNKSLWVARWQGAPVSQEMSFCSDTVVRVFGCIGIPILHDKEMDKVNITWNKSILSTLSFFAGAVSSAKSSSHQYFLIHFIFIFYYKQRMKAAEGNTISVSCLVWYLSRLHAGLIPIRRILIIKYASP